MKFSSIASLFLIFVSLVRAEFTPPTSTWENVKYTKIIDLSRSYVKEGHQIEIKNIAQEPSQLYYFTVPTLLKDSISVFLPTMNKSGQKIALIASELEDSFNELTFFKIQLPYPIAPKATVEFQISLVIIDQVRPLPAAVEEIKDLQSLVYFTNKLPLTVYPTNKYELKFLGFQSTVDELPVSGVSEEVFKAYEGRPVEDQLVYGPYDLSKEPPLQNMPMSLLYNRHAPLVHVNNLRRDIWVSHWSEALQVEEHYQMTNKGAQLKNGFSRVEYMKKKMQAKLNPSINTIEMPLADEDSTEIYYTDLVGNVSTSIIVDGSLVLKPRYPIFGGWNYNFTVGWTNQLTKYVHSVAEDEYVLRVPIISGPRDCSYNGVDFNVYLPAGAKVVAVETPVEHGGYVVDEFYSYLDTLKGHTKISLKFDSLVDEMRNVQVIVKYTYTATDKLAKVASISLYVFIALISFIGIRLIDIRIDVNKKK